MQLRSASDKSPKLPVPGAAKKRILPVGGKKEKAETAEEKEERERKAKIAAEEEAQRVKAFCEELKQEIEVKIQAAGVTSYTLEIVPNAEVKDQSMVVCSCENGTKKIIYQRNGD